MTTPELAVKVDGIRRYKNPHRHGGAPLYASVSHVAEAMPQGWAIPWSALVTATKAVERKDAWQGLEPAEAIAWIKSAPFQTSGDAASRGTLTHKAMEAILKGEPVAQDSGYIQAARAFVRDFRPVTEAVERTIFNESHLFAGTYDWSGTFEAAPDLGRTIVDWKTAKNPYAEHLIQLVGGYALGAEYSMGAGLTEQPWVQPKSALLVYFSADANYRVYQAPMDQRLHRVFRACLEIRRFEAMGLQAQPYTPEQDWNEVYLRQWLDAHPDQQLDVANACREAGIEIRKQYRSAEDTGRILALIKLLEMEEA